MRQLGHEVPPVPGTSDSTLEALELLFEEAGFEDIEKSSIEVTLPYSEFDDFWHAQTPSCNPTTGIIAAMPERERGELVNAVRAGLPTLPDGTIQYSALAHAIKGRVPR